MKPVVFFFDSSDIFSPDGYFPCLQHVLQRRLGLCLIHSPSLSADTVQATEFLTVSGSFAGSLVYCLAGDVGDQMVSFIHRLLPNSPVAIISLGRPERAGKQQASPVVEFEKWNRPLYAWLQTAAETSRTRMAESDASEEAWEAAVDQLQSRHFPRLPRHVWRADLQHLSNLTLRQRQRLRNDTLDVASSFKRETVAGFCAHLPSGLAATSSGFGLHGWAAELIRHQVDWMTEVEQSFQLDVDPVYRQTDDEFFLRGLIYCNVPGFTAPLLELTHHYVGSEAMRAYARSIMSNRQYIPIDEQCTLMT